MKLRHFTLFLLIPIFAFCKTKDKINHTNKFDNHPYTEGWYLKPNEKGDDVRFFAIGGWSVPGYTPNKKDIAHRADADIFKTQARNLNILITNYEYLKDYMSEDGRIMMTFQPFQTVLRYANKMSNAREKGLESGYYISQFLKESVDRPDFIQTIDEDIKLSINKRFANVELAFSPIDEVALGLYNNHWFVPPAIGDKIYERIKTINPNAMVYIDLTGHGRGSSFFFEKRYLKDHSTMPKDPPYEAVKSKIASKYAERAIASGEGLPLLVFNESYSGVPSYNFTHNKYTYKSFTPEEFSDYYENIRQFAEGYKGNGNVFGLNCYQDFYEHPALAGVSVDAIRAGLGDPSIPIWLYFDGNGHSKPENISVDEYIKELKCQIYTSIIHGATGVLFWNNMTKTPAVWNALQPVLDEMKENIDIFKLNTLERNINDDIHINIKIDENGKKYIIASNSNKTKALPLNIKRIEKKSLSPLEVYISSLN
jgi:hypothetical protein